MSKQYWADAGTQNCVWMFQVRYKEYGEDGCTCGYWNHEESCQNEGVEECTCGFQYWRTEAIYLTREEADAHGKARPYAWGDKEEGWRIYGVPAHGIMVDLLGQHNKEFEDKVEYISKYSLMGKVEGCRNSSFNGIDCLESNKQYGFFKNDNDIRPSSCTWIDKEVAERIVELFALSRVGE